MISQYAQELILESGEGNPGAVMVLCLLAHKFPDETFETLLVRLNESDLRGAALHKAFKDICDCDVVALGARISINCAALVKAVEELPHG